MRFLSAAITSLSFAGAILAAPLLAPIQKNAGQITGRHIVQLKDGAVLPTVLESLGIHPEYQWESLNGFAGKFDDPTLMLIRASPDVQLVEEEGVMRTMAVHTQTNAPWGISRISSPDTLAGKDPKALDYTYTYDDASKMGDIDIYVVDTGVQINHVEFEGRARWGTTFGPYLSMDGNGHGTHCAGTAAGKTYGVAKKANIIAVKVMSDLGFGNNADIISGLQWVADQARASGRPSVVSMSLGGDVSETVDKAVQACTDNGVHVVVAAGNDNKDANNNSPARAPSAITVGATTIDDARAEFSNFGSVVDIFAPGYLISSAWINPLKNDATNTISGTSMATPHISGLVAYLIGLKGQMKPEAMSQLLQKMSQKDKLSGIPDDTVNYFAQNK